MKPEIDGSSKRLWSALGASILVNGVLWRAFGSAVMTQQAPPPQTIEISRVVLNRQGKTTPKIVTKKQIERKVTRIQRQIERRKPRIKPILLPIERATLPKKPVARPRIAQNAAQAPDSDKTPPKSRPKNTQGAHNRTLAGRMPRMYGFHGKVRPMRALLNRADKRIWANPSTNRISAKRKPRRKISPPPRPKRSRRTCHFPPIRPFPRSLIQRQRRVLCRPARPNRAAKRAKPLRRASRNPTSPMN